MSDGGGDYDEEDYGFGADGADGDDAGPPPNTTTTTTAAAAGVGAGEGDGGEGDGGDGGGYYADTDAGADAGGVGVGAGVGAGVGVGVGGGANNGAGAPDTYYDDGGYEGGGGEVAAYEGGGYGEGGEFDGGYGEGGYGEGGYGEGGEYYGEEDGPGNGGYGGYSDYEEESEEEGLDPNNPLLAPVQEDLKRQLQSRYEQLVLDLRETEEAARKTKREREELGVELYSVQQQLAKLQTQAEETVDGLSVLTRLRETSEAELDGVRETYDEARAQLSNRREDLKAVQAQLDSVNATLGQVDLYNDELKAQIAVTRRAAYKAEELVSKLEKDKTFQDSRLDALDGQLRRLEDEKALYVAQLESQRAETAAAADTLAEAATEMEAIRFEKKQLIAQWKSSLIGMSRRDEALQAMEDAVQKQRETVQSLDGEIAGTKKAIKAEMEVNERLTSVLNKVETEVRFLGSQVRELNEKKDRHRADYALLQATLEKTEEELAAVNAEKAYYTNSVKGLQRQGDVILNEQREYEDKTKAALTQQLTLAKGAKATKKSAAKIKSTLKESEVALSQAENEKARIDVDILNTAAHNQKLEAFLQVLLKDLKEHEAVIDKYELEIRRRNDAIEKKQKEVDTLNKRYDQLKNNLQDENTGPLEATIHNLKKSIHTQTQECRDLQNYWLRSQQELVNNEKAASEQAEHLRGLRSQLAVLQQKRLRLNALTESHKKKITDYESIVRNHHLELTRLSTAISDNTNSQDKLAESNLTLESEFMQKLKDAEAEAVGLETTIEGLAEEKTFLLGDIIEAERQVMVWEKKIQLARETQAALDPEVGASEVKQMKMEIHRMHLRYTALKKKQEKLIQEMKKSLVRREHIGSRGRLSVKKNSSVTTAMVQRSVKDLTKKLKQVEQETTASEMEIRELDVQQDSVREQIKETKEALEQLRQQEDQLREHLDDVQWTRALKVEDVRRNQRFSQRYEAVAKGKYRPLTSEDKVEEAIEKHEARREDIRGILDALASTHPNHRKFMERLSAATNWKA